jgi:hypothetical protein
MKRTRLVRASIAELRIDIEKAKQRKKYFQDYLKNLHNSYSKKKISYSDYIETIHRYFDGRTIKQWIDYYEFYIQECLREIKKHRKNVYKKNFITSIISIVFIFILMNLIFLIQPKFIGFAIQEPSEVSEIITNTNATTTIIQNFATLNQPVKWTKIISLENPSETRVRIPVEAKNIFVNKISYSEENLEEALQHQTSPFQKEPLSSSGIKEKSKAEFSITGEVILKGDEISGGFLINLWKNFGKITGFSVQQSLLSLQEIEINDTATEFEIEYETPAPYSIEENISRGKQVKIIGPEKIHYENVLVFTELPKEASREQIKIYRTTEGIKEPVKITEYIDEDNNGLIDKIEWIVPHLSTQTFEIIVITKAEHLDSNREFISDIYEEVKELDNIWSETINENEYVRVTFEIPLDFSRDITLYPRVISGEPKIQVYEIDKNEIIAEFTNLNNNQYNTIYLKNLIGTQDTFDLKVLNGDIEIEHIIDPVETLTPIVHTNSQLDGVAIDSTQVSAITNDDSSSVTIAKLELLTTEMSELAEPIDTLNDANCSLIYYTATGYPADSITFEVYDSFGGNQLDIVTLPASDGVDSLVHITDLETKGLSASEVSTMVVYVENTIAAKPYNLYVDKISCMIDYTAQVQDETYPIFSNPTETPSDSATYIYGQDYWFNVTITSTNSTAGIEFDGVNYSLSNVSDNFYKSFNDLAANTEGYSYYYWAYGNGTNHNFNKSDTYTYTINKASLSASITNDRTDTFTYDGTPTNIGISESNNGDSDVNYDLYVNNILEGSTYSQATAGTYNIVLNSTGGQNYSYSASLDTKTLTINKATPTGSISGTSPINYGTAGNVEGTESNSGDSDVQYKLYRDSEEVLNPDNSVLAAGTYDYVYNTTGGTNYTANASIGIFTLIVNQVASSVNLTLNGTQANITIEQGDTINLNCSTKVGDASAYLTMYKNGVLINNGTSPIGNSTTFNTVQVENITCYYRETQNYTTSSETWWVNVTEAKNSAPTIDWVEKIEPQTPVDDSTRTISFLFNATDTDGESNLNDSTASAYFQSTGETTRSNTPCTPTVSSANTQQYNCTIDMWYFDKADTWTVNVTIRDNEEASSENSSTTFVYQTHTGMKISPTEINWGAVGLSDTNVGAEDDPILINNTGNDNNLNINITGYNLQGEEIKTQYIYAHNFSVKNESQGCSGTTMANATSLNITSAILQRGNHSLNYKNATSGQEQIYFCLKGLPQDISSQSYSSSAYGSWEIRILLVALVARRRKKKGKKKKTIENDRLIEALDLILEELKQEYSLNKRELTRIIIEKLKEKHRINNRDLLEIIGIKEIKIPATVFSKELGALEAITKYMKENLNMTYKEISCEIKRNEKTIWNVYQKTKKKNPERIKVKETDLHIPIREFENEKLTILESVIIYLKEKGMKFSEIAKILERDQRNIWTIYSRAIKKLEDNKNI